MATGFNKTQKFDAQGVNWDLKSFEAEEKAAKEIKKLYEYAANRISQLVKKGTFDSSKRFRFGDYKQINEKVNEVLRDLASRVSLTVEKSSAEAWAIGNAKNDNVVEGLTKGLGVSAKKLKDFNFGIKNKEALKAFIKRKSNGMNLSQRIWKGTKVAKKELETAIDIGISGGKSATGISKDIRNSLIEPNKLFRKVDGKPSKNAQAYHPGQGVYRSAYKNAMRVARTETNMAYRTSDFERWQGMKFVKGIEIRLSNNSNHCDMCATLVGKYPKNFKFIGWHPHCRCFVIPMLMKDDEFDGYASAVMNGKGEQYGVSGIQKKIPVGTSKWFEENSDKLKSAKSLPYFIKDNPKYFPITTAAEEVDKVVSKAAAKAVGKVVGKVVGKATSEDFDKLVDKVIDEGADEAVGKVAEKIYGSKGAGIADSETNLRIEEESKEVLKSAIKDSESRFYLDLVRKNKKFEELTLAEKYSIKVYTTNQYAYINDFLRNDRTTSKFNTEHTEKYLNAVSNTLNRALEAAKHNRYEGTVYRGTQLNENLLEPYIRAFKNKTEVTEKAFMSTSYKEERAFDGNVEFKVKSKTGVKVEELSSMSYEKEVLFKAGTKFRVTNATQAKNGKWLIELEEI